MAPGSSSCSRPRATPKPPLRPGPPRSRLIAGAAARGVDAASKWGREDSNLRRLSRRVYSPFPLAARAHPQGRRIVARSAPRDCGFGQDTDAHEPRLSLVDVWRDELVLGADAEALEARVEACPLRDLCAMAAGIHRYSRAN